jgi:hypothetical protein
MEVITSGNRTSTIIPSRFTALAIRAAKGTVDTGETTRKAVTEEVMAKNPQTVIMAVNLSMVA